MAHTPPDLIHMDALSAVLTVVAGGVGAYLGSYLKERGKSLATKDDFNELLGQLKQQTAATEIIKADVTQRLNDYSDKLERARTFDTFHRDRISSYLNEILTAYLRLEALAQLLGLRDWVASNSDFEATKEYRLQVSSMNLHLRALISLNVVPQILQRDFNWALGAMDHRWDKLMGEAALRTQAFQTEVPHGPAFDNLRFHHKWLEFMSELKKIGDVVVSLPGAIELPR